MDELIWLIEPVRIWLSGGSVEEITRTQGFVALMALFVMLIPSTLIIIGLGVDDWRQTPLAAHLGLGRTSEDNCWPETSQDFGEGPLEPPRD